jgi:hypothetical protein
VFDHPLSVFIIDLEKNDILIKLQAFVEPDEGIFVVDSFIKRIRIIVLV